MTNSKIDSSAKIRPEHLERKAYVYIRQSSLGQVRDHVEGRLRQYQMVDWAEQAGWPKERIVVIDEDQGKSASVAESRAGFGGLVTAAGRGGPRGNSTLRSPRIGLWQESWRGDGMSG